jgi:hypothetical protein
MKELRLLETTTLVDMLAAYTEEYLKLSDEMSNETAFAKCALTVKALQMEIAARRAKQSKPGLTDPTISNR